MATCIAAFAGLDTANAESAHDEHAQGSTSFDLKHDYYKMDDGGEVPTTSFAESSWEIQGPISLRSADPTPPGVLRIKNTFGWVTTDNDDGDDDDFFFGDDDDHDGDDDDHFVYELVVEWGIAQDHVLLFELPFELGDGRVDGNGDLTVGWHWRLWEEHDGMPAFAMRNSLRFPTGVDSNGVDYEWKGLITHTLIHEQTRAHVNPFVRWVDDENHEYADDFQWGALVGIDHKLRDDLLLIVDYKYSYGEYEESEDHHAAEIGLDWTIASNQVIGIAAEFALDDNDHAPEFGARVSYVYSFGG
jgi:hypothetical protein